MAAAIVTVILKLGSLLIQEGRSFGGVHDQVESLQKELMQIHSFLKDAEDKEITSANVRTWLADIQHVTHEAENLIDTFILKNEQQRRRIFFKRYFLLFNDFLALRKFGKKIAQIQTNIRSIYDRRTIYDIQTIGRDRGEPSSSTETLRQQRKISPQYREMMPPVGLSNDVKLLEDRLIQGSLRRNVISIVGMGGVGKTTLAKILYNSVVVRSHFHYFAWVYVSQQFQPCDLLHEIKNQIIKSRDEEMGLANESNVAEESLYQLLLHKKYMIVLDDVWTTNMWTSIEGDFPNSNIGSRIVLTTRKRDVALHAEPTNTPYELQLLDGEDSWKLFTNTLYKVEKNCPQDLEGLGRSIVGKCGNLPLAIKLIGGLLSTKKETHEAWFNVFHSFPWHLNQDPVQCSSILAMSYYDLPSYLKPCFRYFATFPKGFQIPVKRLIRLWIAEGMIQERAEEELEDIGNDYIEELVDRNMIQLTNKDRTGNLHLSTEEEKKRKMTRAVIEENLGGRNLACIMHDLVRELSLSMAREADFLDVYANKRNVVSSSNLNNKRVHRLGVHFDRNNSPSWIGSFPYLHSLLIFDLSEGGTQVGEEIQNFLARNFDSVHFRWLTVLDLEGTYKPMLPDDLGKLKHLRYLGLRCTWLERLPPSVAGLGNLQTLDLKCTDIQIIPSEIFRMKQLRHLYLNGGLRSSVFLLPSIRNNSIIYFGRDLRTLCGIFVGPEDCVTDRLEKLTNIRKLAIEGDLLSQGEALGNWIGQLQRLEHLKLKSTAGELTIYFSGGVEQTIESSSVSSVLSRFSIVPEHSYSLPFFMHGLRNPHLTKLHLQGKLNGSRFLGDIRMLSNLTLAGTRIYDDPMEILKDLPNLRILRLWYNSYKGSSMVCSSRSFPKLEVLEVCWLDELECWDIDEGALPNLRELEINKCNNLREFPNGLVYLSNLKELRLPAMSDVLKSRVLPNTGEDWSKIKHIPFISPPLCSDAPFTASASTSSAAAASASVATSAAAAASASTSAAAAAASSTSSSSHSPTVRLHSKQKARLDEEEE